MHPLFWVEARYILYVVGCGLFAIVCISMFFYLLEDLSLYSIPEINIATAELYPRIILGVAGATNILMGILLINEFFELYRKKTALK